MLNEQLLLKFSTLDYRYIERMNTASETLLDLWLERILVAGTLEEIFAA